MQDRPFTRENQAHDTASSVISMRIEEFMRRFWPNGREEGLSHSRDNLTQVQRDISGSHLQYLGSQLHHTMCKFGLPGSLYASN